MQQLPEQAERQAQKVMVNSPHKVSGIGPFAMFILILLIIGLIGYTIYAFTGRSISTTGFNGTTIIERHNVEGGGSSSEDNASKDSDK